MFTSESRNKQDNPASMAAGTGNWSQRLRGAIRQTFSIPARMRYQTTVHPCVIAGTRTLVFKRGLEKTNPDAFRALQRYADTNGFALKEDQRTGDRPVPQERRVRFLPTMVLSGSMLLPVAAVAETEGLNVGSPQAASAEVEVIGERESASRPYLVEKGKRFIAGPFGEVEAIKAVASEVRRRGQFSKVRTRGIHMPATTTETFVDRFDYTFPSHCGGGTYSYYEGEGFSALGYHTEDEKVILDVMVGGGAFTAPKLWGPYDQVLNDNTKMHLMFGNAKSDKMGLLKSSYVIGKVPVMSDTKLQAYGAKYSEEVMTSVQCASSPDRRLADVTSPDDV